MYQAKILNKTLLLLIFRVDFCCSKLHYLAAHLSNHFKLKINHQGQKKNIGGVQVTRKFDGQTDGDDNNSNNSNR